jgi:glutamyl-tRNAGlu reductase-like protein
MTSAQIAAQLQWMLRNVRLYSGVVGCGDSVASSPWKGVRVVITTEVNIPPVLDSEVSGTIVSLRESFEAVRLGEIHRVRGLLRNLSADQEDTVESLSRSIIEKVLQAPVAMLLNAGAASQSENFVETVRKLFNLRT